MYTISNMQLRVMKPISNGLGFTVAPASPLVALQLIMPTWLVVVLRRWRLASGAAVQFARDGIGHIAELLLLLLKVLRRGRGAVLLKPIGGFFDSFQELRDRR